MSREDVLRPTVPDRRVTRKGGAALALRPPARSPSVSALSLTRTVPTVSVIAILFPAVPASSAARLAYVSALVVPSVAVIPVIPTVAPFVIPEPNFTFESRSTINRKF